MAHFQPIQPSNTQSCCSTPTKKTIQNLAFALTLIVTLSAVLVGVLGSYQIDFFAGIGTHVSQGLALGGGALGAIAIIAYIASVCSCRNSPEELEQQAQAPDPNPKPSNMRKVRKRAISKPSPPDIPGSNTPPETPLQSTAQSQPPSPLPSKVIEVPQPEIQVEQLSQPLTWQPLIDLKNRRAQLSLCTLPKECPFLEKVAKHLPPSTRPLMPQAQFIAKMQELYRNLLLGKCTLVIDMEEKTFTRKGTPPLDIISQAQRCVRKQIEAYNALLPPTKPKIQNESFFQNFAKEEQDLQPEKILKFHRSTFQFSLTSDLGALFEAEKDAGLELRHLDEIKSYINQQVAQFNEQNTEQIDPEDIHEKFAFLEGQLKLWKQMQVITCFNGAIDLKIQAFSNFNDALLEPDHPAWDFFPLFKTLMQKEFAAMHTGFFTEHQFFVCPAKVNPEDQVRQAQVDSVMGAIACKLGTTPPAIHIEMDTSNDTEKARLVQEAWHAQEAERLSNETIARLRRAGPIR